MRRRKRSRRGLTLVELLTVVVEDGLYLGQWGPVGIPLLALIATDGTVVEVLVGTDAVERISRLDTDPW